MINVVMWHQLDMHPWNTLKTRGEMEEKWNYKVKLNVLTVKLDIIYIYTYFFIC
jgi:hypothetical protein